jgi:toxin ParE1/3/4
VSDRTRQWTVRLTAAAEADFEHIVQWTIDRFGEKQAVVYAETLSLALQALSEGPSIVDAKARAEILKGLFSLHVARQGRKGRHFILFRVARRGAGDVIEVLRLLHDSMDLPRHFGAADEVG